MWCPLPCAALAWLGIAALMSAPSPAHAVPSARAFPADESGWPIIEMSGTAGPARTVLPAGSDVLDLSVTADGRLVLALVRTASGTQLLAWDLIGAPVPVGGVPAGTVEIQASPFGGAIF